MQWHTSIPIHGPLLTLSHLSCYLGSRPLFEDMHLSLNARTRLGICGPNGSGKSSLLHYIRWQHEAKPLMPEQIRAFTWSGSVAFASRLTLAYADQKTVDYGSTPLQWVISQSVSDSDREIRTEAQTLLACLGLSGQIVHQSFSSLSPGEQQRVIMAGLLIQKPHVLILDEPTNHLALPAREALERTLQNYKGALILVSHDRSFRESLVTETLTLGSPAPLRRV